ncbi:hypothetical protein MGYG_07098 [Nannizzia gypsea CBS 118893]|uniref:Uncharacterized protein n=1 Tax=Arthroderma gypseum (strain ATCC MYA-4604 / CBS 118893) TaxID=535722 RepID=E4V226_ARTGP|nr:hypothetical protein MGYG_07098 [Nannizzia gypsea CBS 118893]EFR04091.1 hypothetical protein MGYG_07098 [Nannizzia gypsea CBS 118893]
MHSLIKLAASCLLLFTISCNALPLISSRDIEPRRDSQPNHSLAGDEVASAWTKILCQPRLPRDSAGEIAATFEEELAGDQNQNDDQMIIKTGNEAQDADTKAITRNIKPSYTPSVAPSQTSGYSPGASGVIANSRDYDFLPDELNGYARSSTGCPLIANESNSIAHGRGRIEFLTPGIIITGVVILLLVTVAIFDFMQWIRLYRRRLRSKQRRRSSVTVFIIGEKGDNNLTYCDDDDFRGRKDIMNV